MCWGEDDEDKDKCGQGSAARQIIPQWWKADAVRPWLANALACLPVQHKTLRLSDTVEENISFIVDKDNRFFCGVGADKLWPAAERLCTYLEAALKVPGVALELGAGCSVPGVVLARRGWRVSLPYSLTALHPAPLAYLLTLPLRTSSPTHPLRRVTLTDLPWILPLVEANLDANGLSSRERPAVASLRWGCRLDADALADAGFAPAGADLVYGADIAYFEEDHAALLDTLDHLRAATNVIAIQHRQGCHLSFAAAAKARGWTVAEAAVQSDLHGYPVVHRFCCSRCSVLVLTRRKATPADGAPDDLLLLERDSRTGRSRWLWRGSPSACTV